MAKKMVSYCVGCTGMGLYCRGRSCKNYGYQPEYTCDRCGGVCDPECLYDVDGEMVCKGCLLFEYFTIAQLEEDSNEHRDKYYCDKCGDEYDPEYLYDVDGEALCEECLLNNYQTVAQIEED